MREKTNVDRDTDEIVGREPEGEEIDRKGQGENRMQAKAAPHPEKQYFPPDSQPGKPAPPPDSVPPNTPTESGHEDRDRRQTDETEIPVRASDER